MALVTQSVMVAGLVACIPPASADTPARAVVLVRGQAMDVSYDSLSRALGEADPLAVQTLLDAGLKVGRADAARATNVVISGLSTACVGKPQTAEKLAQALEILADHGFPVDYADTLGNTILLSAAQFCTAPVVSRLVALGAPVDPRNKQDFTPLKMALVSGKWDVVAVLVDNGARITRDESKQLFFEPPQEPAQRALLERATR